MGINDKVLIINGSPRKNKNCSSIIKEIVKKLEENQINYKVLDIYKMNIEYCTACGAADKPEEKPAACGTACGASDK